MSYHSEYAEDQWIGENLTLPERGVYCDVGCGYEDYASNTKFLRERGWTGVAIDADPGHAPQWAGFNFVNAIISPHPTVGFEYNGGLSRVTAGAPLVQTRTLESVLKEHNINKIDFLSIDVEAHEFEAMQSFDLEKYMPGGVIVAEYNTWGIGEDFRVKEYLEARGWREVWRTVANILYQKP